MHICMLVLLALFALNWNMSLPIKLHPYIALFDKDKRSMFVRKHKSSYMCAKIKNFFGAREDL